MEFEPPSFLLEHFCPILVLGERLILRYFMYGSIHVSDLSMVLTMKLMLGLGSTSQIISRAADVSAELASFAIESAYAF